MKKLRFLDIRNNLIKPIPEFIKVMKQELYDYHANPIRDVFYQNKAPKPKFSDYLE